MKLPCKKNEIIFVVWKDTVGGSGRCHLDDIENIHAATNTNLGWIVAENNEVIRLANGSSTTGEIDYLDILACNVLERIPLASKRSKERKKENDTPRLQRNDSK